MPFIIKKTVITKLGKSIKEFNIKYKNKKDEYEEMDIKDLTKIVEELQKRENKSDKKMNIVIWGKLAFPITVNGYDTEYIEGEVDDYLRGRVKDTKNFKTFSQASIKFV